MNYKIVKSGMTMMIEREKTNVTDADVTMG
jgi:hypothetical protein